MKSLAQQQFYVLLFGTVFAWVNFGRELNDWLHHRACTTGCPVGMTNPFLTPCFFGALFFTIALVYSFLIFKKASGEQAE
ncbi:MAG: hypothetical protein OEV93_00915 [Candidatus Moranbacteria bacterium]|nr:hypothetical protein [Candidatus Moranbacteria bacterium]